MKNEAKRGGRERIPADLVRDHFREKALPPEMTIRVDASPARIAEQAYFVLHLVKKNVTLSADPVFSGLFSAGRPSHSIQGWIDGDYFERATFPDGTSISLSELGLDLQLFKILGELVPPGGSLMISYSLSSKESRVHKETKLALDRGYPPVVTPLGFLLFMAGCGMSFKDWYFAEGGREGPEKLQGYKPIDSEVAKQKAQLMLKELHVFSNRCQNVDSLERVCKSRADAVIQELDKSLK